MRQEYPDIGPGVVESTTREELGALRDLPVQDCLVILTERAARTRLERRSSVARRPSGDARAQARVSRSAHA
ncbi:MULTISPECIES: three-helix bundle dimerization domain-containing protein [unclassified Agrococcus]|uniref:three-helix bundle dimerization domain-containing protein n=1 Tax=unclassified Agrococcus TaxID=2615065 RepID=UPI00360F7013